MNKTKLITVIIIASLTISQALTQIGHEPIKPVTYEYKNTTSTEYTNGTIKTVNRQWKREIGSENELFGGWTMNKLINETKQLTPEEEITSLKAEIEILKTQMATLEARR